MHFLVLYVDTSSMLAQNATCQLYIWHITVYDWQSHDLPLKHAAKPVLLALRCRRPLVMPDYATELFHAYMQRKRIDKSSYVKFSIPRNHEFLKEFRTVFTRQCSIEKRNIDLNRYAKLSDLHELGIIRVE